MLLSYPRFTTGSLLKMGTALNIEFDEHHQKHEEQGHVQLSTCEGAYGN